MTISVDAWFEKVMSGAQLAPNKIIRADIVEVCRDICARTKLWTSALTPIDVVANQAEYALTTTGADICGVDRAEFDDSPMNPTSDTALDEDTREIDPAWRPRTTAIPERYFATEQYDIRLVYIPDADLTGGLDVWAYLMPVPEAIVVPLFLYNEFKELVTIGTLGRLKMRPDMPWSDVKTGAAFMDVYESKMQTAKQKKFTGFQRVRTRDIVRTRYHDF